MMQIIVDCPYCGTKNSVMRVFGCTYIDEYGESCYVAAVCNECSHFVSIVIDIETDHQVAFLAYIVKNVVADENILITDDKIRISFVSSPEGIKIPPHLPMSIEAIYRKAKELQAMDGFLEESATNYRKAIEHAIKATHPEVYSPVKKETVNLYTAIERLAAQNIIPESLKHLAHGIRLIGNEATHGTESDLEGITAEQIKDASTFTEAFLTYLISLPEQLHQQFPDNQEFKSPLVGQRDENSGEQSPE